MKNNPVTCRLKLMLTQHGLRNCDFAKQHGLSSPNLSAIIAGHRLPRLPLAEKIASSLSLKVLDIWPDYYSIISGRLAKQRQTIAAYHQSLRKKKRINKAWPCRSPQHQKELHIKADLKKVRAENRISPNNPNAVPLADGSSASAFTLQPAAATDDQLQDPRWCRAHARRMHDYLVRNCAYGVYLELRGIMAEENRLFEGRVDHEFKVSM